MTATAPDVDIDALYRSHRLAMVRLAHLLVDDLASAEDAVQSAFCGMWRNQQALRSPDAAVGYLRRAVVNECRSAAPTSARC
jgi:DNA-directed RNA polymerase specialized sigma24 family protein